MAASTPGPATVIELERSLRLPGTKTDQVVESIISVGLSCESLGEGLHAAVLLKEEQRFAEAGQIFQRLTSRWPTEERLAYEHIQFLRRINANDAADHMLISVVERGVTGDNILRECLVRGFIETRSSDTAHPQMQQMARGVVNAAGSPYIHAYVDYLDSVDLTTVINRQRQYREPALTAIYEQCQHAVTTASPFCLLRLGDGEGAFLHPGRRNDAHDPMLQNHAEFFAKRWYNNAALATDPGFLAAAECLRTQVSQADLVGAPQATWLTHEIAQRNLRSIVCCLELVRLCQEAGFDQSERMTTTTVAMDLEFRQLITALFESSRSVSLITSHPQLADRLAAGGRVRIRQTMLIPPAHSDLGHTGYEASRPHFPGAFDEVNRMIDAIPAGELVLIGAGFLGKLYALRVKERGGIALDVGSLLDLWMGFITRPGFLQVKHMVLGAPDLTEPATAAPCAALAVPAAAETKPKAGEDDGRTEEVAAVNDTPGVVAPAPSGIESAARALTNGADPIHWVKEALRHRDQNRHDVAEGILKQVIEHRPAIEAAHYELAFMRRVQREPRQAVQILDNALRHTGGNRMMLLRGHMLHACEAHDEGIAALNAIVPDGADERDSLHAMFAFGAYLRQFPLGRALVMLDRQKAQSGWLDATAVARRVGAAIQAKAPFALVRLGDGEGGMLKLDAADEAAYERLYDRNRQELIRIWFGDSFDWRHGPFLREAQTLPKTLALCDVIGIPYESWLRHEYGISSLRGVPSLLNVYRMLRQDDAVGQKPVCSQHVHLDLFQEGHLVPLIKAAGQVSVVTCLPEVAGLLRNRFDLADVKLHLIPAEQGSRAALGEDAGSGLHYPDAFHRIQADLAVPQFGRLFLVAGGLLGKFYCGTIRSNGGIALDIGSLVDGWAGRATRPGYGQRFKL